MKKLYLLAFAALTAASAFSQEEKPNQFTIDAQLRARAEYRNGVLSPRNEGDIPSFFINERARLSIGYERKNLSMRFSVQHVGVWGQDPQIDSYGRVVMNEAWANVCTNNGKFFAKLGRQSLSYDGDRILGTLDWNVAGRWHDALKLGFKSTEHEVNVVLAINQNSERKIGGMYYDQATAMLYKSMQFGWYHFKSKSVPVQLSLSLLNLGSESGTQEKSGTVYLQNFGTKFDYGKPNLNFCLEAYYQTGQRVKDVNKSAFMVAFNGNVKPVPILNIGVGIDYLSGNDGKGDKDKAFDPLFGTHHKYYGSMDYFYAQTWNKFGLINPHASIEVACGKKVAIQGTYHYFATAGDPKPYVNGEVGRGLGSEIDLQVTAKILPFITLQAGYSTMLGTKNMDMLKGGYHKSWQDWGWIQLNINPQILKIKW